MEKIKGFVEKVRFRDNKYVVLQLDSDGVENIAVGVLGDISEGEFLVLKGEYTNHPKYGLRFNAKYCERKLPEKAVGIEKYLASGAVGSINKKLAERIVSVFGDDTLEIMENSPDRLCEVRGISPELCQEIEYESRAIFERSTLITFLAKYETESVYAVRMYNIYGRKSIDIIRKNPYVLCDEGIELKYNRANYIADGIGIPQNAECRIIALIKQFLTVNTRNGHTCLPYDSLITAAARYYSEEDIMSAYSLALEQDELAEYSINGRKYVYKYDYYVAENFAAERIKQLSSLSYSDYPDYDCLIDIEEQENNIQYAPEQRNAIATAIERDVMVLTGGPGTGKTTTLRAIISVMEKEGRKVALAAPTGRAAKRMNELTGHYASTIHRLLEAEYDSDGIQTFARNEETPIDCDVLIIDEMSMVDSFLFEKLLRAMRGGCKLIMAGDFNQLPSVGPGNILESLVYSNIVPVVKLTDIFRQARQSDIVINAHRIVSGEYPVLQNNNDFFFVEKSDSESADFIVDLVKNQLMGNYNYSVYDDIQIITPVHMGSTGTDELNGILQESLNPSDDDKDEIVIGDTVFRVGDKVMETKNNYGIRWTRNYQGGMGIFNGDIGRITEISPNRRLIYIDFDGRSAEYSFESAVTLELAYAITVHKSQGCEFEAVVMPVLPGYDRLCYRSLLYTAVTRARKLLILVGSEETIRNMVDTNNNKKRFSCFRNMLERKDEQNG
ncbi:MAG: ATP-dependent RecD-like DNA helicase [Ruminococcus flavefaciens]|nr:ATP-dependent RecD-like DNA helicase [Ruminococcus flavefaciens]MCM1230979.1 ATP-dependent RecD-like DNA helicase [Ruminococcus flavefaciens]